jgi:hypothetical protein
MRYVKKCPKCDNEMHYDEDRDTYCCLLCQICMPSVGHKRVNENLKKENKNEKVK